VLGVGREECCHARFVSDWCGHTRALLDGEEGECGVVATQFAHGGVVGSDELAGECALGHGGEDGGEDSFFEVGTGEVEIDFASADGVGEAQGDVDSVGFEFHSLGVFVFVFFGAHGVLRNEGKVDGV